MENTTPGWPCQTPERAEKTPERLVALLYVLTRDYIAPGDLEQVLLNLAAYDVGERGVYTNAHLEGLARAHASFIMETADAMNFPYQDGNFTIIGPEAFASSDHATVSWKGVNYVVQDGEDLEARRNAEQGDGVSEQEAV